MYEDNEFNKYEYIAEPSACPICAELDGKVFELEEMEIGKNACPMHPHCHCATAPVYSEDEEENSVQIEQNYSIIKERDNSRFLQLGKEDLPELIIENGKVDVENKKQIYSYSQNGEMFGYIGTSNSFRINHF